MDQMVVMTGPGGTDRLKVMPNPMQKPGPGMVRVRHHAIGVNFLDTYHRTGLYPLPAMPAVLGVEGAGVIEAVGPGVTHVAVGDRVAYAGAPVGAYSATRLLPASKVCRLPDDLSFRLAAASMLRGLTAHMLLTVTYPVGPGDMVLIHAAAGGLGGMLARWAKHLGAIVIGTVGSAAKIAGAEAHGADHVIVGRDADFAREVAALTEGRGVDFAVDGIGGDTLVKTIACVRPFGTIASIGQAAGPIPPLPVELLGPKKPISLARHSVMAYAADPVRYPKAVEAVYAAMRLGIVATIGADYPLTDAARAHADLEGGISTGSLLLIP